MCSGIGVSLQVIRTGHGLNEELQGSNKPDRVIVLKVEEGYHIYRFPLFLHAIKKHNMKFSLDKQDQYAVFTLDEENLNSLIAPNLKSEFVFMRNEGVRNLIFDLSKVAYVDSSGLSSILTANRIWKDYGSFIVTGIVHPAVKRLIEISRLESILTIIPTLQEAIDYAMMEELEREIGAEEEEATDN